MWKEIKKNLKKWIFGSNYMRKLLRSPSTPLSFAKATEGRRDKCASLQAAFLIEN